MGSGAYLAISRRQTTANYPDSYRSLVTQARGPEGLDLFYNFMILTV